MALPDSPRLPDASVQLYSLAKEFSADMGGSLDKLAAIDLRNVEAFDFVSRPAEIRAALDASGLASPTPATRRCCPTSCGRPTAPSPRPRPRSSSRRRPRSA